MFDIQIMPQYWWYKHLNNTSVLDDPSPEHSSQIGALWLRAHTIWIIMTQNASFLNKHVTTNLRINKQQKYPFYTSLKMSTLHCFELNVFFNIIENQLKLTRIRWTLKFSRNRSIFIYRKCYPIQDMTVTISFYCSNVMQHTPVWFLSCNGGFCLSKITVDRITSGLCTLRGQTIPLCT